MLSEAQMDEIDRLVAERVMGWRAAPLYDSGEVEIYVDGTGRRQIWVAGWRPTRERGHAMQVFEKCPGMHIEHGHCDNGYDWYTAYCEHEKGVVLTSTHWFEGKDVKLPICLAALKRVGAEAPSV